MRNSHGPNKLNFNLRGLIHVDIHLGYFGVGIIVCRNLIRDNCSMYVCHVNVCCGMDIQKPHLYGFCHGVFGAESQYDDACTRAGLRVLFIYILILTYQHVSFALAY